MPDLFVDMTGTSPDFTVKFSSIMTIVLNMELTAANEMVIIAIVMGNVVYGLKVVRLQIILQGNQMVRLRLEENYNFFLHYPIY